MKKKVLWPVLAAGFLFLCCMVFFQNQRTVRPAVPQKISMLLRRIDRSKIYPPFLEQISLLLSNCLATDAVYVATEGYRSAEDQARMHAIGRGPQTQERIITNARPFESYHNFGLAVDMVRDINLEDWGVQPGWKREDYETVAQESRKLNLESGYYFENFNPEGDGAADASHVQFPLPEGVTLEDLKAWYLEEGLKGVWHELDARRAVSK